MSMLTIRNPATGEIITTLPADDTASVTAKAQAARDAQPSWAALPLSQRLACIERFRALVVRDLEVLATVMTRETGKPIRMSRNELNGLLPRIDFFLKEAEGAVARETVYDEGGGVAGSMREQIEHVPLGVVANISAWNYPWFVGCNVILPALVTGNAVLYKPSEFAAMTGQEIARLLHEAGVPREIMVCLIGEGAVGSALLQQPIDGVFFTGSVATGRRIAEAVGHRFIKLQLELGGKDPTYVCDDADARTAAESLADGAMYNTGQSCCSVERIYVHEKIHDAFVSALVDTVKTYRMGDPMSEDTYIGAITRAPQLQVLADQVADARSRGAKLLAGGGIGKGPGQWFEPTVMTDVDHSMAIMREESFGPVIGVQKVKDDAEAVRLMNDTRYGLTAGVYTPDEARARAILSQVHAGSVYWNCCDRVSPRLPWSGVGDSGVGLTLSRYGIQAFTRPKAWHLRAA
ncbi:MAG TPA: aldehyde dehydrogenase family protein [Ramlibacter sp.]|uniref:aldehyde dehydrogenase family protein n=1 Tax=Ramlibacter sp. TaxID=1917967 RepID=UPI002BC1CD36|nr:aldehyde dehydrogenase family protein [Ramlibacter sp.]HVZ47005.1 aldehyde dehydrogenase family protein [Ramlibacter sp.]